MTGFLLAWCAAAGVALIWLGGVLHVRPQLPAGRLAALLREAEVSVRPVVFVAGCLVLGIVAGLAASALVDAPVLALASG
ncbi:MAG: hypothetical protein ACRDPC_21825, partial [Solirubrobacteraceae bacterium]